MEKVLVCELHHIESMVFFLKEEGVSEEGKLVMEEEGKNG